MNDVCFQDVNLAVQELSTAGGVLVLLHDIVLSSTWNIARDHEYVDLSFFVIGIIVIIMIFNDMLLSLACIMITFLRPFIELLKS